MLLTPASIAALQAGAWYVNAKRFAVGTAGPIWFPAHASWSPPAGWTPWLLAILAAALCLAAIPVLERRAARP